MSNVRQTSRMSVISLVSGILGWTLLPIIGSLAGVIAGHIARAEIRARPDQLEGNGMALAGLILGWLSIAFWLLLIVAMIAILPH